MTEAFEALAAQLEEVADSLGLDMLQPTVEHDVLRLGFVAREQRTFEPTGDDAFDAIVANFDM